MFPIIIITMTRRRATNSKVSCDTVKTNSSPHKLHMSQAYQDIAIIILTKQTLVMMMLKKMMLVMMVLKMKKMIHTAFSHPRAFLSTDTAPAT